MATWVQMNVQEQYFDTNGDPLSGGVIKAYEPGGLVQISIAIDSAGGSPQASITLNANGQPTVSGNKVLLFIDRVHKWGVFANATDAAANTPFFIGPFDNVEPSTTLASILADGIAPPVADYTELRSITVSGYTSGTVINVTDEGIAGSGVLINSVAHGLTDNGGTIIVIDSSWYWRRDYSGYVNPQWFGVTGDGSTNDTSKIQDAVDSFTSSGVLEFPPGAYVVTSPIVTSTGANDRVVSIVGSGWGTINAPTLSATRFLNGGDDNCFETASLGGQRFEGFSILDTLGVSRTQGAGIFADRISPDEGNVSLYIKDVYVKEHYDGFEMSRGVLASFENCYAHTNQNDGFKLSASSGAGSGTSITFKGCFAIANGNDGYTVDGHNYIVFDNTASDGNGRYGYRVHNTTGFNPTAILFNEAGAEVNTSDSINVSNATAVVINGGAMFTSGGNGITLTNVNGATSVSTKFSGNTGYGISATGTSANITLISPHFVANTAGNIDDTNNAMTRIGVDSEGISSPAGSALAPALGFNSEATGMYLLAAGQLGLTVEGTRRVRLTSSTLAPADSAGVDLGSGSLPWKNAFINQYLEFDEMTAPGAPGTDTCRMFVRDNGGKTELCAIFNTGAIQVIATQP